MNWYKLSQSSFFEWFKDQSLKLMEEGGSISEEDVDNLNQWAKETKADLSEHNLSSAIFHARKYVNDKKFSRKYMSELGKYQQTHDEAIAHSQNIYPHAPNFMVDMRAKEQSIPTKNKTKINKDIYNLGNFHESIPMQSIFNILQENKIIPLQEDGTYWSGMLLGGKACGSEEAKNQRIIINLAVNMNERYFLSKNVLSVTWCTMPSGKYEVVAYVS